MKKLVFSISLCALALSASAQFKVQSNGNIAVQTISTAASPISINSAGSSSYYVYCNTGGINGISLTATGNNNKIDRPVRKYKQFKYWSWCIWYHLW